MLRILRSHIQTWVLKAILIFVAITFIGWGAGYLGKTQKEFEIIAEVYDIPITYGEWQNSLKSLDEFYKNIYKDILPGDFTKRLNLKEMALNDLLRKNILLYSAEKEGLVVTKEELIDHIQTNPLFVRNGKFDERSYKFLLSRNRITPKEFEASQRNEILIKKMGDLIKDSVMISKRELLDAFQRENEEIQVEYLLLKPLYFKSKIKISQQDIEEFYNKNKEEFREPEKRKIKYIYLNPKDFMKKVRIDKTAIEEYYFDHEEEYNLPKKIRARQILIRIPQNSSQEKKEKARKKTEMIIKRLKKGEDFSKLAREYSEDSSARKGGDLGYFKKGEMIQEFDKVAFSLKKGEISHPVLTPFGYHIIKVEDIKEASIKELKDVRDEIEKKLTENEADYLAEDKANEIFEDIMRTGIDLKEIAQRYSFDLKTTGFFNKQENEIKGIKNSGNLISSAFSLELGEVSEIVKLDNGYYIFKLLDIKKSSIPSLDTIKPRLRDVLKTEKMKNAAFRKGEEILTQLKTTKELKDIAEKLGLKTATTGYFSRASSIPGIGIDLNFINQAFRLKKGENTIVKSDDGVYIIKLLGKKPTDMNKFKQAREDLANRLLIQKREKVFQSWIQNKIDIAYQKQLIKINRELFSD
jgi:peptidyl-prolyl cis-trans isomerase D